MQVTPSADRLRSYFTGQAGQVGALGQDFAIYLSWAEIQRRSRRLDSKDYHHFMKAVAVLIAGYENTEGLGQSKDAQAEQGEHVEGDREHIQQEASRILNGSMPSPSGTTDEIHAI